MKIYTDKKQNGRWIPASAGMTSGSTLPRVRRLSYLPFIKIIFCVTIVCSLSSCIPLLIGGGGAVAIVGGKLAKQEKTVGQSISDTTIWSKIRANLSRRGIDNVMMGSINVKVNEGRVLLTGTIPSKYKIVTILKACWSVNGVQEVINELRISKKKGSLLSRASDAWITTKIKSQLLAPRNIASVNYTAETMDGVVYLFGIARSQDELDRVTDIVSSMSKVKKIVSYVRVKKDVREKISRTKGNKKFLTDERNEDLESYDFDSSDNKSAETYSMDKPTIIKPNQIHHGDDSKDTETFEKDDY